MKIVNRAVSLALLAAPMIASAQKPLMLTKAETEFGDPFSAIAGIRELKDGRVIVIDRRDKSVQILNFKSGATRIGREGSGPGEFQLPNALVALPGDSTAIWDGMNRRYALVGPTGNHVREFRLEPPEGRSNRGYGAFAATFPRGVDARGNIYFQGSPFINGPDGQAPADSIPVLRFNRATQLAETTAFVHPPPGNARVSATPSGRGVSVSNGLSNPLVPLDEWTALPNGSVAVVRGENYRVDIYSSRSSMKPGPLAPFQKARVDGAIKAVIVADRRRQLAELSPRSRPGGGGDEPTIPSNVVERLMNLEPWPEFVPPFVRGAVMARPVGTAAQVWVLRTQRSERDSARYDIFDATGRVAGSAVLAPRTTIIGFGQGTAYAIRTDDDGLQYLQRHRLPAEAKPGG